MAEQTMVERVARAIHAVEFEPGDNEAAATMECPALREFRLAQARAAIEAMRVPSDAMLKAHHVVPDDNDFEDRALRNWQAMIDAALAEGKHAASPPKA